MGNLSRDEDFRMRIFAASLATETNSFSPIPTSRASYEQTMYFPPGHIRTAARFALGRSGSRGGAPSRRVLS